jgi:hypothetical protein
MIDSHVKCRYIFYFLLEDEEDKDILVSIEDEKVNHINQLYFCCADNSVTVLAVTWLRTCRST